MAKGDPTRALEAYLKSIELYRKVYPQLSRRCVRHRVQHLDKEATTDALKALDGILGDIKESRKEIKWQAEAYLLKGA